MEENEVKDTDPTGRYIKFASELGRGAYKVVYKAIDRDLGIEVAWNEIRVDQGADFDKLWKEIELLQQLSHPNVLECHHAWVDEKNLYVAFITESMTSGNLRSFMKKVKKVKLKVIKNWCIQILEGLNYLHTRDPPIIHRDIKCDNIFINGNIGQLKIGDLGLATNIVKYASSTKMSIIGTPEFMAPEFYEEDYNEKVDIWAFGMCVLELATQKYPYSECTSPAQIFKKVISGEKPQDLNLIKDAEVLEFINECLAPLEQRKSAAELLAHPFLQNVDDESNNRFIELAESPPNSLNGHPPNPPNYAIESSGYKSGSPRFHSSYLNNSQDRNEGQSKPISIHPMYDSKIKPIHVNSPNQNQGGMDITVLTPEDNSADPHIINLSLSLAFGNQVSRIEFDYNINEDTPLEVAKEMIVEFDLPESNIQTISEYIEKIVDEYMQHMNSKSKFKSPDLPTTVIDIIPNGILKSFSERVISLKNSTDDGGKPRELEKSKSSNFTFPFHFDEELKKEEKKLQKLKLIAETNKSSCDAALKAFEMDMKSMGINQELNENNLNV